MRRIFLCWAALVCSGCMIHENTNWDNPLDPANSRREGMILLQGGTYRMGSGSTISGHQDEVLHTVKVYPFLIDSVPIMQMDWDVFEDTNPSSHRLCPLCPVDGVNWYEAILLCNIRSKRSGLDSVYKWTSKQYTSGILTGLLGFTSDRSKNGYRLPTEAEWEFAVRAKTTTKYFWGDDPTGFGMYAWAENNSGGNTHPVESKLPNPYGLYDMVGNIWQWMEDGYGSYDTTQTIDPVGVSDAHGFRSMRGGSWHDTLDILASANRGAADPGMKKISTGIRCVRSWKR